MHTYVQIYHSYKYYAIMYHTHGYASLITQQEHNENACPELGTWRMSRFNPVLNYVEVKHQEQLLYLIIMAKFD